MVAKIMLKPFALLAFLAIGSFAQSNLLATLRREGFTEFASFLEGPGGVNVLNFPGNLLVYAPTNAAFRLSAASPSSSANLTRRISDRDADAEQYCVPTSSGKRRKRDAVCGEVSGPGAVDLMTLLSDPEFVNLPLGQNSSIVQKNMPKGALPVVHTGLGQAVKVTGLDIPFDHGAIRPISGVFALPRLLSVTLPFLGAERTLDILQRTGLIRDFDTRTGITFLAPDRSAFPPDLPDAVLVAIMKRHLIVGLPVFTSDMKQGDTYKTLAGTTVTVTVQCAEIFIGGARILAGDAIIKNGVAHVVDKLLEIPIVLTTTEVKTVTQTTTTTAACTKTSEITRIQTIEKTQTVVITQTTERIFTETTTRTQTPPPAPPRPPTSRSTDLTGALTPLPPPPPPPPPPTSTWAPLPPPLPPVTTKPSSFRTTAALLPVLSPTVSTSSTSSLCTTSKLHPLPPPPHTTLHTSQAQRPYKPHESP